jgi:hypothetical protein
LLSRYDYESNDKWITNNVMNTKYLQDKAKMHSSPRKEYLI